MRSNFFVAVGIACVFVAVAVCAYNLSEINSRLERAGYTLISEDLFVHGDIEVISADIDPDMQLLLDDITRHQDSIDEFIAEHDQRMAERAEEPAVFITSTSSPLDEITASFDGQHLDCEIVEMGGGHSIQCSTPGAMTADFPVSGTY